jgi:hypothetical protein
VIDTNLKSTKNQLEEISFPEFSEMSFTEQRKEDKN